MSIREFSSLSNAYGVCPELAACRTSGPGLRIPWSKRLLGTGRMSPLSSFVETTASARILQCLPSSRGCSDDGAAGMYAESSANCPYHGWTYGLEGDLKGTPDFAGVCNFDRQAIGLVPVETAVWEKWVFVQTRSGRSTAKRVPGRRFDRSVQTFGIGQGFIGSNAVTTRSNVTGKCSSITISMAVITFHICTKGSTACWTIANITPENGTNHCLQSSPVIRDNAEPETSAVRVGNRALYYLIHPNSMDQLV